MGNLKNGQKPHNDVDVNAVKQKRSNEISEDFLGDCLIKIDLLCDEKE